MGFIKKIELPDNNIYDIKNTIIPVVGTQSAATNVWLGSIDIPGLYDGLTIVYHLPYASTGNVTLNLTLSGGTTTGAIDCYFDSNKLSNQFTAGVDVILTYWSAGSISINGVTTNSNRWIAQVNDNYKELTQEQYNNLSFNEKNNGTTYFITDGKEEKTVIYGFHINGNDSSPSARVIYLQDAIGMTPAYMNYTSGTFNYGSWGDVWFIKNCKPCILGHNGQVIKYLNSNDYTKDINGETVTIDENLENADVMIEFPKIWYKIIPDSNDATSANVYISNNKVDNDYHDYAYIDYQGRHKEHFYLSAYNASTINNKLRSISGQTTTKTKSLNGTTEISYAKATGKGWNIEHLGQITLINLLLILIGKSTDTQAVFGQGLINSGSEAVNIDFPTGIHNDKGLFYGTNNGTASTYTNAVKVFGIENWWGFIWNRYFGDMLINGVTKTKYCYGMEDGSTTFDFNTTGNGYITTTTPVPTGTSGHYCYAANWDSNGFNTYAANNTIGSSSKYYCDGLWFNNSGSQFAFRGGDSGRSVHCGAFYRHLAFAVSAARWYIAARKAYI